MNDYRWLVYALLSALAASTVGIFGKMGMKDIDSNLATAVRSVVMTGFLLGVCTVMRLWPKLETVGGKALLAIVLSGVAGAVSWLFYFKAIQLGEISKVAPIDKLSMPFAVILAVVIFREPTRPINWIGVSLIVAGAYLAAVPTKA